MNKFMKNKTNAGRLLEQAGISYGTYEYEPDEKNLSGEHVAAQIGVPKEQVFKTLVACGKEGIYVFCIPVMEELSLKKAALVTREKKIEMVHQKDLLGLTGYIRGGCSPVGMKKKYPTFMDETAQLFETVTVSAGVRGLQMEVEPTALMKFVQGTFADLTE
ncbi:Cys-tRNA(Pro) deacylase [Anaerocolumna xylanovorans]|uniref:Cys-tRNA(Pro)/Cys-tRNA(Cys) deacylase n=1 Tax=Anaerocolumna xylanovorans DSM 12503 TaxID=1121345 RepID=A0A1M7Y1R6_9FIRM|nr:Cys-tRNA(Pro) deacylase [Anaerocolumna xylanovorans]SHO45769.1 Cys-tRNA(Pro)/Cys-tRNA(Cys) deacylase [Anaerocolumna xylanovorans DSM 12503]